MAALAQLAYIGLTLWITRFLYRIIFAGHALDNVPGPTPVSWLTGKVPLTLGIQGGIITLHSR